MRSASSRLCEWRRAGFLILLHLGSIAVIGSGQGRLAVLNPNGSVLRVRFLLLAGVPDSRFTEFEDVDKYPKAIAAGGAGCHDTGKLGVRS
jgi:hypothetical protein